MAIISLLNIPTLGVIERVVCKSAASYKHVLFLSVWAVVDTKRASVRSRLLFNQCLCNNTGFLMLQGIYSHTLWHRLDSNSMLMAIALRIRKDT